MRFSRFFIDRPIFAAVLSLVIIAGGSAGAARGCRSASIPASSRPRSSCAAIYPGANPKVIAETVASPLEQQINGVEDMLYMFSQATADGRMTLTITFALGTDLDNGAGAGAEPRGAGAAAAAAGSAAHRRHHREGVARPHDGRAPRLARRALRHALPVELRAPAGEGRAGADSRRRQRPGVRRRRVQHARLAGPGRAGRARADGHRRRAGDPRAERAGGGRRARRAAGAHRHHVPAARSTRRAG